MKKLLIILALTLPLLTKAQRIPVVDSVGNVIYYIEDTIKIPLSVAKQIAIDLSTCDSTREILNYVEQELDLTKQVLTYKDSLLTRATINVINLSKQLGNEQGQKDSYKLLYTNTKSDYESLAIKYRKHKALRNFVDIVVFLGAATIMYLTTTK